MKRPVPIPDSVTVRVPFRLEKRGGRKEMVMPPGTTPRQAQIDNTLVKALARAFRWKKMLESGGFPTIGDLAAREKNCPELYDAHHVDDIVGSGNRRKHRRRARSKSADGRVAIAIANPLGAAAREFLMSAAGCLFSHT